MSKKLTKEQIHARTLKENAKQREIDRRQLCEEYHSIRRENIGHIYVGGEYSKFRARLDGDYYAKATMETIVMLLSAATEYYDKDTDYIFCIWLPLFNHSMTFVIADIDTGKVKRLVWMRNTGAVLYENNEETELCFREHPEEYGFTHQSDVQQFIGYMHNGYFEEGHARRVEFLNEELEESI